MFIVIISDVHRSVDKAKRIIENCKNADLFICLGDGADAFISICEEICVPHTEVAGNCDLFFTNPRAVESFTLELAGKRIFACHGHKFGVKSGYGNITSNAILKEADVALFGHTHVQHLEYVEREGKDPMILLNPGSVHDGGCFATLDIRNGQILPNLTKL